MNNFSHLEKYKGDVHGDTRNVNFDCHILISFHGEYNNKY